MIAKGYNTLFMAIIIVMFFQYLKLNTLTEYCITLGKDYIYQVKLADARQSHNLTYQELDLNITRAIVNKLYN